MGIVFCHGSSIYYYCNPRILTNFNISFFITFFTSGRFISIPLFVMISGALLINKQYSFKNFFTKRLNRIFVPFAFWIIIYLLFSKFILHKHLTSKYIMEIIFGEGGKLGVIFWFIWMILIVYIGIFLINKILEHGKEKYKEFDKKFLTILTILSLIIYVLINLGLISSYPSQIGYYILFIPYAVFGYYLSNLKSNNLKFLKKYKINAKTIIISTLLVSIIGYVFYVNYVVLESMKFNTYTSGSYFQLIVMIFSFAIFLFFKNISYSNGKYLKKFYTFLYSKSVKKITCSISYCSFGIYFIHFLLLKFITKVIIKGFHYENEPLFWTPILLITVFMGSWILTLILSKIPFINRFSGVT